MKKILLLCLLFSLQINASHSLSHKNLEKEVENFLNSTNSIQADFVQISSSETKKGNLFIKKPQKARLNYNTPEKFLLILKGGRLIYYNFELEEFANTAYNSNFIDILAAENFSFSNFASYSVNKAAGQVSAKMTADGDKDSPAFAVEIIFDIKGDALEIKSININDYISPQTTIYLQNVKYNLPVSDSQFHFKNPKFFKK